MNEFLSNEDVRLWELLQKVSIKSLPAVIELRDKNNKQIGMMHTDSPILRYIGWMMVIDWYVTNDTENSVIIINVRL